MHHSEIEILNVAGSHGGQWQFIGHIGRHPLNAFEQHEQTYNLESHHKTHVETVPKSRGTFMIESEVCFELELVALELHL